MVGKIDQLLLWLVRRARWPFLGEINLNAKIMIIAIKLIPILQHSCVLRGVRCAREWETVTIRWLVGLFRTLSSVLFAGNIMHKCQKLSKISSVIF